MDNQTSLAHFSEGAMKLPEIFAKEDLWTMLQVLDNSRYWKNEYGRWLRSRDKCLLMTQYTFAMRISELVNIKFEDFNPINMTLHIRGKYNHVKKDRILPVPESLKPFYKEYLSFTKERFWRGSPYLFPSQKNCKISTSTWRMIFRDKILKPMGKWEPSEFPNYGKYRNHTLRHSRATHLLDETKDINASKEVLGNTLQATEIYTHISKDYFSYLRRVMS